MAAWWPAVAAEAIGNGGVLIVRLENGVTLPAERSRLRPRDPALHGNDKPDNHADDGSRTTRFER